MHGRFPQRAVRLQPQRHPLADGRGAGQAAVRHDAPIVDSVGVHAGELDRFAVAVLDEIGIDLHAITASRSTTSTRRSFDLIVTLSPEAHHSALEFTRSAATDVEYWPIPDPSAVEGSRETRLDAYRRTRDMILARLKARFGTPSGPTI